MVAAIVVVIALVMASEDVMKDRKTYPAMTSRYPRSAVK